MPRLKGPVPQVQAKEGPMPQLVKKRRSGWALLAVGALVASILAVGTTPVAAVERNADQQAQWRVCLGPAMADQGFADVSMDSVHYDNINCLKYYGITTGRTEDSFAPDSNVTRSQMALFLARSADAAGIVLGEFVDQGFVDVNVDDTERANAINRMVSARIMFGDTNSSFDPPSNTHFAPTDHVTRWEMAMFLFAFLDHALDSVLVDQLPDSIEGNDDGVGGIEINARDGVGDRVDDYFLDAERQTPAHVAARIGAVYELGVTTGTNDMVGEAGTFEPNGLVTREQMASFIMRALGHTNLRPAGLTAQHTPTQTQVSVRDADFDPIVDERVEVFYSNFSDHAFDSSGECDESFVGDYAPSFNPCEMDRGDELTDDFGNVTYPFGSELSNTLSIVCSQPPETGGTAGSYTLTVDAPSSIAQFSAWAWRGDLYEDVDSRTELFEVEPANAVSTGAEATYAVVSGGPEELGDGYEHIKMGETLIYKVQLSAPVLLPDGSQSGKYTPAAPSAGENYGFSVTVVKHYQALGTDNVPNAEFPFAISLASEQTRLPGAFYPDSSGAFEVRVNNRDPVLAGPSRDNRDVQVQIIVSALLGNDLSLVDSTTGTAIPADGNGTESGTLDADLTTNPPTPVRVVSGAARFSDNDPAAAVVSIEPETTLRLLAETGRNSLSVSVLDQYNNAFRPPIGGYSVNVDPSSIADNTDTADVDESAGTMVAIRTFGKGSHGYTYGGGSTPSVETIGVTADLMDLTAAGNATTEAEDTATATVFWAGVGSVMRQITAQRVYLADASQRLIAIEVTGNDGEPIAYQYGDEDRFVVEGEVVSFEQFEAIISAKASDVHLTGPDGDRTVTADNATLEWDDYRRSGLNRRPTTDATWRLEQLACGEGA